MKNNTITTKELYKEANGKNMVLHTHVLMFDNTRPEPISNEEMNSTLEYDSVSRSADNELTLALRATNDILKILAVNKADREKLSYNDIPVIIQDLRKQLAESWKI